MPELPTLVAVYGSLRKGLGNHHRLETSHFVGTSVISGYTMYSLGGFPAVFYSDSEEDEITIELYRVDNEDVMSSLDSLEGHPNWYRRELVQTPAGEAWMYIMTDESYRTRQVVSHGDWTSYVRGNR